jgi:Na+-transporting methylmalonyl-CoA/oxaloacetate decarboxylase gamma subunit
LKIFKLFRSGDLKILVDSITFTLSTIGDYVILLSLFIYVFALLGMSFFAGRIKFNALDKYDEHGEAPRTNFDGLFWAIITIF